MDVWRRRVARFLGVGNVLIGVLGLADILLTVRDVVKGYSNQIGAQHFVGVFVAVATVAGLWFAALIYAGVGLLRLRISARALSKVLYCFQLLFFVAGIVASSGLARVGELDISIMLALGYTNAAGAAVYAFVALAIMILFLRGRAPLGASLPSESAPSPLPGR